MPVPTRWESLQLVVTGRNLVGGPQPGMGEGAKLENVGRHVLHTGGAYDAVLRLPVLAAD